MGQGAGWFGMGWGAVWDGGRGAACMACACARLRPALKKCSIDCSPGLWGVRWVQGGEEWVACTPREGRTGSVWGMGAVPHCRTTINQSLWARTTSLRPSHHIQGIRHPPHTDPSYLPRPPSPRRLQARPPPPPRARPPPPAGRVGQIRVRQAQATAFPVGNDRAHGVHSVSMQLEIRVWPAPPAGLPAARSSPMRCPRPGARARGLPAQAAGP